MQTSRKIILSFVCAAAALALLVVVGPLAYEAEAAGDVPDWITYQGMLTDADGEPISGTVMMQFQIYAAESGGTPLWSEPAAGVSVVEGRFTVLLGTITPLNSTVFDGAERYVEVIVDGTPLPRQRLSAVPYAHRAYVATSAISATFATYAVTTTHATTATYATTATHALNGPVGEPTAGRVTVAKSGGDFTSIRDALDSIGDASAENPVLVWVAPGVYTETGVVRVKSHVHLQGAGPEITIIRSLQGGSSVSDAAAALEMRAHSRVSDLSVVNRNGSNNVAIGIWAGSTVTRSTVIENVHVTVSGAGGTGHYALYLHDAEPFLRASRLQASGAVGAGSAVNAALASANPIAANVPEPLVENSILIGGGDNGKSCVDGTGTGYGVHATETNLHIRSSYICGGHRGIAAFTGGSVDVHGSEIWTSTTDGAFLFESMAAARIRVATSLVAHSGGMQHTGTGSLICVHSFTLDFRKASDNQSAGLACI